MPIILGLLMLIGSIAANAKTIELTKSNHVVIDQYISSDLIHYKTIEVFDKLMFAKKDSPFYIVLNTPGGKVRDALLFVETLVGLLSPNVHTISIYAASSGYIISQLLGNRYIIESGYMFHHNISFYTSKDTTVSKIDYNVRFEDQLIKKLSKRVGKDLYEDIKNEINLTSEDAIIGNHADEVVNIKCSQELIREEVHVPVFKNKTIYHIKTRACPLLIPFGGY